MFSLLSAPYLLHINVKLNVIIHKQIEAKPFHGPRNTFEHIYKTITLAAANTRSPKNVRFILYFPILKQILLTFLHLVTSKYIKIMTYCLNSVY